MKRSRKIIVVSLLAIIAGIVFYLYAGSAAPAGQPPLARLNASNFGDLRSAFNRAKDTVRVIAMLSPT